MELEFHRQGVTEQVAAFVIYRLIGVQSVFHPWLIAPPRPSQGRATAANQSPKPR
jgi:hypothetical protein